MSIVHEDYVKILAVLKFDIYVKGVKSFCFSLIFIVWVLFWKNVSSLCVWYSFIKLGVFSILGIAKFVSIGVSLCSSGKVFFYYLLCWFLLNITLIFTWDNILKLSWQKLELNLMIYKYLKLLRFNGKVFLKIIPILSRYGHF